MNEKGFAAQEFSGRSAATAEMERKQQAAYDTMVLHAGQPHPHFTHRPQHDDALTVNDPMSRKGLDRVIDAMYADEQQECGTEAYKRPETTQPMQTSRAYDRGTTGKQDAEKAAFEHSADRRYRVWMPAGVIRVLAGSGICDNDLTKDLRSQAPMAFIGDAVSLSPDMDATSRMQPESIVGFVAEGGPVCYIELDGPHKAKGLHLDSRYIWEIVPAVGGHGMTLVAREKF